MKRWPWITMGLTLALALTPFGLDLIHTAFYSGEQLARDLSQFLLTCFMAGLAALVLIEFAIRAFVARRRARNSVASGSTGLEA